MCGHPSRIRSRDRTACRFRPGISGIRWTGRSRLIEDLVAANRILTQQGVLDESGHVSIRHPANPNRYLMARSLSPALVTSEDIMEFDLDSNPIDQRGRRLALERFIHGEVYKVRQDVNAFIHTHSPSVIPFSVTSVPLRPIILPAAFLWTGVPVFDTRNAGVPAADMLIRNRDLGRDRLDCRSTTGLPPC